MSLGADGCENQNSVKDESENENKVNVIDLESVVNDTENKMADQAVSGRNEEVVHGVLGDESDGLLKKLRKLGCGVVPKRSPKTEEIEPYCKTEENWTYSKVSVDVDDDDVNDDKVKSDEAGTRNNQDIVNLTDSDYYNFNYPKRGYMLLVINEKFYNQATRTGADLDLIKMKAIAKKFDFDILNIDAETNLTKDETLNWLNKAQTMDHSFCDCFMFMISTHGLEQRNPRRGGELDHALVCADDQLIFTSTVVEMFNETNCPSLKGKPKMFIIQACRGTSVDDGSEMNISSKKGKASSYVKDRKAKYDANSDESDTKHAQDSWDKNVSHDIETPCLKCDVDMLIMYAIPPGMLAWRNTVDGSWMIHYMHEILLAYDMEFPKSFLHVLTKISAKMAHRSTDTPSMPEIHEKKAIPVIENMLTRDILFCKKHLIL